MALGVAAATQFAVAVQVTGRLRLRSRGAPGILGAWGTRVHMGARAVRGGAVLCSVLGCAWERREEERRKKGEGKKRKRRKRKGDAGGIRGDGREPGVASMRSDAHEK